MIPDFVCVLREPEFSPGRVEDDAGILLAVASVLRNRGYTVELVQAHAQRWPRIGTETLVLSMAQGTPALERLRVWEVEGVRVINSVSAVQNCRRAVTDRLLRQGGIPHPPTRLLPLDAQVLPTEWFASGVWIKRGDFHAMAEGDVSLVHSPVEADAALGRLRGRGVEYAVVQQNVTGRVVKFYVVAEQFLCVTDGGVPVAVQRKIGTLARRAAALLGLEVFGGDCVVTQAGECLLIDLNDWPSYARCRLSAAAAIAAYAQAEKGKGSSQE